MAGRRRDLRENDNAEPKAEGLSGCLQLSRAGGTFTKLGPEAHGDNESQEERRFTPLCHLGTPSGHSGCHAPIPFGLPSLKLLA